MVLLLPYKQALQHTTHIKYRLIRGNITLTKHKQRTKHEDTSISTHPKLARLFLCVGKTNKKTDIRIPHPGSP